MALPTVAAGLQFIEPVSSERSRRSTQIEPQKVDTASNHAAIDPTESRTSLEPQSRDELLRPLDRPHLSLQDIHTQISRRSISQQRNVTEHFEEGSPTDAFASSEAYQGVPPELKNLLAEIICILACSMGQLLFAFYLGNTLVNMFNFASALDINYSLTPWLTGSFLLPLGLSVVVSGSISDLSGPKPLMVGAFAWLTLWNIVGSFSISPSRKILFFVVRAMQGLAVGVLVSASMSVLGRIYRPGVRKTRVFSFMAAMAPLGCWVGALQGGALQAHLPWIFGSGALICGLCCTAAILTVPSLRPVKDTMEGEAPSMKNFDYLGASCLTSACALVLFGLTQGSATHWNPYTYSLVILGIVLFVLFFFVEKKASRPIIPNALWTTPGFLPLIISYFLGIGSYIGAWFFYMVQFWLRYQNATPLNVALRITPNAVAGLLATWIVSRTLHKIPGHWILTVSMVAYAFGPVFFLPQTPGTSYWALAMPGIFLNTFGPDLSFAAASIFITSSVPKSYQGSAGSLLVTVQNLSAAIVTSVADSIGNRVDSDANGLIGLQGMRAIWWFALGLDIVGAVICATMVRIAKTEEKEHIH